jgi:hypothetical protein
MMFASFKPATVCFCSTWGEHTVMDQFFDIVVLGKSRLQYLRVMWFEDIFHFAGRTA